MLLVQCNGSTYAQAKQTGGKLRATKEGFLLGGEELVALDNLSVLHYQQLAVAVADELAGREEAVGGGIVS